MAENSALRFIRCWANEDVYALDMKWVRSIQRIDQLERADGDRGEAGWLRTAGMRVPVWALTERLKTAVSQSANSQRIIVLNDAVRPWAILVDQVSQVTQVERPASFTMPDIAVNWKKPYFLGVVLWNDQLLLRLDPDALHPDSETKLLQRHEDHEEEITADEVENGRLPTSNKSGQIVVFQLPSHDDENAPSFALSITQVPEILDPLPTLTIPNAPSYVHGLLNWRNQPVTLIDLGEWMGTEGMVQYNDFDTDQHGRYRLMIVRRTGKNGLIGFLVRPSIQVLRLPLLHQPVNIDDDSPLNGKVVRGVVQRSNGEMIIIPAME